MGNYGVGRSSADDVGHTVRAHIMALNIDSTPNVADLEDQGRRITLKDADGEDWSDDEGKPVTALVAGTYSKRYAQARTAGLTRSLKARGKLTGDDLEATNLKLDAALVIAWDITSGGQMAKPEQVFQSHPFIREQIVEEANAHASFSRTASTGR